MKPIRIPFPDKLLWPNGSESNRYARSKAKDKAKVWATIAALEAGMRGDHSGIERPIPIMLMVYPKLYGPLPDRDNCIAAMKHSLDAIANVMGVNDRDFAAPTVEFGPREARFEVIVGASRMTDEDNPARAVPLFLCLFISIVLVAWACWAYFGGHS